MTNTGDRNGDDSVLLFLSPPNAGAGLSICLVLTYSNYLIVVDGNPIQFLAGFERINLDPGQSQLVSFGLSAFQLSTVNAAGLWYGESAYLVSRCM